MMLKPLADAAASRGRRGALELLARRRAANGSRAVARVLDGCRRLLSERGEANSLAIAADLMPRLAASRSASLTTPETLPQLTSPMGASAGP